MENWCRFAFYNNIFLIVQTFISVNVSRKFAREQEREKHTALPIRCFYGLYSYRLQLSTNQHVTDQSVIVKRLFICVQSFLFFKTLRLLPVLSPRPNSNYFGHHHRTLMVVGFRYFVCLKHQVPLLILFSSVIVNCCENCPFLINRRNLMYKSTLCWALTKTSR